MGIRSHNSSWRQPLVVLDYLPAESQHPTRPALRWWQRSIALLFRTCRRPVFERQGSKPLHGSHGSSLPCQQSAPPARPPALRVIRRQDVAPGGVGQTRLVLSGRLQDVCAELDRLAGLEASLAGPRN